MRIFFYTTQDGPTGGSLAAQLGRLPCIDEVVILHGDSLWSDPRSLELRDGDILLLFAASRTGLEALAAEREHFLEFRVVLVLPDLAKETMRLASQLNPRFMAGKNDVSGGLAAVLNKMLNTENHDAIRPGWRACPGNAGGSHVS